MTGFTGAPSVTRGAIIGIDIFNPLASVTIFSYNPATMTRTLRPKISGADGAPSDMRIGGPPIETISLKVAIDATDQLEQGDGLAQTLGIHPQLAALELLLYPKTAQVIANAIMGTVGTMEVAAPLAPLTLFIWGIKRVLPVLVTTMSINEQAYDPNLNPIRAEVTLAMRVLTYQDLGATNPGSYIFLAHQVAKEVMGTIGSLNAIGGSVGGSFSF